MSVEKWIEVNNDYLLLMNDFTFVLVKFLKATYITIRKTFFKKNQDTSYPYVKISRINKTTFLKKYTSSVCKVKPTSVKHSRRR